MSKKLDIICIGKTTIDQFLILNEMTMKYHLDPKTGFLSFKHGEKIDVEDSEFCVGGNATNVAVGLKRLGLSVGLFSEIGDDEFGLKIRNVMKEEEIDDSFMIKKKEAPSSFSVIINFKGERTIFMQRMRRDHEFSFDGVLPNYVFLTSLENEWRKPYFETLSIVKKNGYKLAFNPGTLQLNEGRDIVIQILNHTNILFVNKEEAERLVFGHDKRMKNNEVKYIKELLVKLKKMGPKIVVVTNGRYGSHALDDAGNFSHVGLFPGLVVERTGAGDSYTSGFLAATIYGKSIKEAMRWGAVNAAAVVERVGAINGLLKKDELESREIDHKHEEKPVVDSRQFNHILGKAFGKLGLR